MHIVMESDALELNPALHGYVEARLARLGRHFEHPLHLHVRLSRVDNEFEADATTRILPGRNVHVGVRDRDLYTAIGILADKLDRALIRHSIAAQDSGI